MTGKRGATCSLESSLIEGRCYAILAESLVSHYGSTQPTLSQATQMPPASERASEQASKQASKQCHDLPVKTSPASVVSDDASEDLDAFGLALPFATLAIPPSSSSLSQVPPLVACLSEHEEYLEVEHCPQHRKRATRVHSAHRRRIAGEMPFFPPHGLQTVVV